MDILNPFINNGIMRAINIDKFQDGDIISRCDKCGDPDGICKVILNRKYACKVGCKCSIAAAKDQKARDYLLERQQTISKYFGDISDNKTYENCTFKNWDFNKVNKSYYDIFYTYAAEFEQNYMTNTGLFIEGNPGNGKTYAAACVVNEIIKKDYIGIIIQLTKLIEKAECFKSDGITASMVYKKLRYADLIVLDDFGVEKKFDKEKIYSIINEIYIAASPIIITTNLTMDEVKEYHSRIRSRINSMAPIVINIKENNLRMAEGKAKKSFFNTLLNKVTGGKRD